MKVLLISANRLTSPYPVYPLGLDYVAGAVEPGHQVRIVDLCGADDDRPVVEAIFGFAPDLVGISLRNIDNTDSANSVGFIGELRKVVETVRSATRAPVVLGGSGFSLFPRAVLDTVRADYGVVGEGERFGRLLDALQAGRPVDGLEGVVVPGQDMRSAPEPFGGECRRRLPEGPDRTGLYLGRGGMLNMQTKRGCPFSCLYCTYPLIEGGKLRLFSPEHKGAEARALQEAGARYLFIADSAFNADHAHAAEVALAMQRAGVTIPWGAFLAPLAAPDGFYQRLAEAGCTHAEFGTDTLCPGMLATYRKAFSVLDVTETHAAAVAAGLHAAHYFMLGGPGESAATVDETLDNVERLDRSVSFFFCGIRIYPGTGLWKIAVEQGQVDAGDDLLEPVFYRPEHISPAEVIARVGQRAGGRTNWVIGAGGEQTDRILERMYARGRTGPLWEFLIR